jgi:hypothetical protein
MESYKVELAHHYPKFFAMYLEPVYTTSVSHVMDPGVSRDLVKVHVIAKEAMDAQEEPHSPSHEGEGLHP